MTITKVDFVEMDVDILKKRNLEMDKEITELLRKKRKNILRIKGLTQLKKGDTHE